MKKLKILSLLLLLLASRLAAQMVTRDTLILHFPYDRNDTICEVLASDRLPGKPIDSIRITGHTDIQGSQNYNQALSLRRAQFIRSQLGRLHPAWPAAIFRIVAMGKTDLISPIDSVNRRVEVIFFSHRPPVAPVSALSPPSLAPPRPAGPDTVRPANIDTVITLTQIYFIENTPVFTEASQLALPSVMAYLKRYKTRTMRVLGYVNSPGALLDKNDRLFILSTKRAQAVYMYMLSEGFDSRRLSYQGMGNSVMIKPHPMSLAEMRENMRVEIEVDKE
ncbi:MAG: OmpA family protein [Bacteroidota bacterium]|nr:OmpA family protein [Bacteroidota bacterium]